jgi:hypothetical protein
MDHVKVIPTKLQKLTPNWKPPAFEAKQKTPPTNEQLASSVHELFTAEVWQDRTRQNTK